MSDYGTNPFTPPPPATSPPPPILFQLRPLSLGEILDRTFSLYRQRFWLYCGLASFAAVVATLGTFARLTFGLTSARLQANDARAVWISAVVAFAAGFLYFIAYSVTQAATVFAVSASYLGHQTSITEAMLNVKPHWFRYLLIALWQALSALWLTVVLASVAIPLLAVPRLNLGWLGGTLLVCAGFSLIYGVIAYIRNSLGIAASVSERLPVRPAMRRSKQLVAGSKGRVLAILLLMYVLNLVAGVLQGVFAVFLTLSHATAARIALEAMTLIMVFVTSSLVAPVPAIAFCIFYIDQRVRKEGFDVEILMERAAPASPIATESARPFA